MTPAHLDKAETQLFSRVTTFQVAHDKIIVVLDDPQNDV